MIMRGRQRSGGFSLVELLVVLAIVGILMGISIPILRMFSQNDIDRGARSLYTMIRAARVYASTHNVKTAVVYQLDGNPVQDTLRRQPVRVVRGAMVVYQLSAQTGGYKDLYVPTTENGGEFQPFPFGYSVLLDVPPPDLPAPMQGKAVGPNFLPPVDYTQNPPDPDPALAYDLPETPSSDPKMKIAKLGMVWVQVYTGTVDTAVDPSDSDKTWLLAHVFDTGGKLVADATTQRFRILFAPAPDRPVEERTWSAMTVDDSMLDLWWQQQKPGAGFDPDAIVPQMGMIGIPIEIYRSTGRVRMGSL